LFGRLSASRLIVYGFLALVAGGTALLKLPWTTTDGISFVNAFFVAVSCSTVTGLLTAAIPETFTHFGELVMMQLGGLGIMTVTTLATLLVGQRVGFRRLLAVGEETENAGSPRNTLRLLFQIARITFTVELLGAVALSIGFVQAGLGLGEGIFQPRTAGFQTVSYPEMREPTLVVQTVLMFIGTAPTSTGGGIKVTTLALVVLIVVAQVRGQDRITLFWRTLPRPLISRALSVLAMASLLVLLSTLALMVSDGLELLPALFEVTSAFGTVGLSLDVTPHLSTFGKILISVVMFLGRVGPITFIVALAARQRTPQYRYPEEEIAIG
jgi:Trk-type K+ transport system membrane component